jgi:hypothetical protein
MRKTKLFLVLAFCTALLAGTSASADCVGLPDLDRSIIRQNFNGQATLLVLPDGSGPPLTAARTPAGAVVDATIFITIISFCEVEEPVAAYPREDIWLDSMDGGLVLCPGGSVADADTDLNGMTQWSQPISAGGWDQGEAMVRINGDVPPDGAGLTLNFNSPDLNGDRDVNLSDLVEFTEDYYTGYYFRSDFHRDGALNLSDVAIMASSLGKGCP